MIAGVPGVENEVLGSPTKETTTSCANEGKLAFGLVLLALEVLIILSTLLPRFFLSFLFEVALWGTAANAISVVFFAWMNGVMAWMVFRAGASGGDFAPQ